MIWTSHTIRRIILDTAGRLLQKQHAGLPSTTGVSLDLYRDLGLDSIQRMELAAYLNELFGLFETSAENYLLADTSLTHWENCILRARHEADDYLTFRTSGTQGSSRAIRHGMRSLLAEAEFLTQLLPRPSQVVSLVPANHIYGFLYTIVLPTLWKCPLRLLADITVQDIDEDTLLIGTPFTWEFALKSLFNGRPLRCWGVSSTAPVPPGLFEQLNQMGVAMTEIYGSTDTGGLGYRHQPDAPFRLFPYWTLLPGDPVQVSRADTGDTYTIPDRLEQISERDVYVLGRIDEAVQIAGINVYPTQIRQVIESCPLVQECDVFAKAENGVPALYGAVRLRQLTDANREAFLRWLHQNLTAAETPKHLYMY